MAVGEDEAIMPEEPEPVAIVEMPIARLTESYATIGEALEAVSKLELPPLEIVWGEQERYFLRWDERDYESGDLLPPSRVWIEGEPTEELLRGTSAIDFSHPERFNTLARQLRYAGDVYLIKGFRYADGEDIGEVIVDEARVVRKL